MLCLVIFNLSNVDDELAAPIPRHSIVVDSSKVARIDLNILPFSFEGYVICFTCFTCVTCFTYRFCFFGHAAGLNAANRGIVVWAILSFVASIATIVIVIVNPLYRDAARDAVWCKTAVFCTFNVRVFNECAALNVAGWASSKVSRIDLARFRCCFPFTGFTGFTSVGEAVDRACHQVRYAVQGHTVRHVAEVRQIKSSKCPVIAYNKGNHRAQQCLFIKTIMKTLVAWRVGGSV